MRTSGISGHFAGYRNGDDHVYEYCTNETKRKTDLLLVTDPLMKLVINIMSTITQAH